MARTFNGTTDKISWGTSDVVGAGNPWSVFAWIFPTASANGTIIAKRDSFSVGGNQFGMGYNSNNTIGMAVDNNFHNFAFSVPLNVWNAVGISSDSISVVGYGNGTGSTQGGNFLSGSGTTQAIGVGAFITENSTFFTGRIGEVAAWNAKLTAGEQAALALGVRAYLVRPGFLQFYAPLFGFLSEPDLSGKARSATITGTTAVNDAPMTLFTPKSITVPQFTTSPPPVAGPSSARYVIQGIAG